MRKSIGALKAYVEIYVFGIGRSDAFNFESEQMYIVVLYNTTSLNYIDCYQGRHKPFLLIVQ